MLTVIIPTLNAAAFIPDLVRRVQASLEPGDSIIVVDDGSDDGTLALAQAGGAQVLSTPHPRCGPAVARNLGAVHATGDVLVFFDADVMPHPGALARIRAAFAADPGLDALFGSYDNTPTARGFLSQYKNLFHHYVHQHGAEEASTFWTGCGAVRRDVFVRLGGFTDEYGRPCIEDIELGYRLARQGGRIRLDKQLLVTHRKHWTRSGLLRTDIVDRGIPWAELILRHRAFVNDLNLQTHNRVSVVTLWLLLVSLGLSLYDPRSLVIALGLALLLLLLNLQLYRWFASERGWGFALRVIPWHWLYYGYNAVAFVLGALRYGRSAFARGHLHPNRPGALAERTAE